MEFERPNSYAGGQAMCGAYWPSEGTWLLGCVLPGAIRESVTLAPPEVSCRQLGRRRWGRGGISSVLCLIRSSADAVLGRQPKHVSCFKS